METKNENLYQRHPLLRPGILFTKKQQRIIKRHVRKQKILKAVNIAMSFLKG